MINKKVLIGLLFFVQTTMPIDEKDIFSLFNVSADFSSDWIEQLNQHGIKQSMQNKRETNYSLPLFKVFPGLKEIPYLSFADLPTPIDKLENMSKKLNINLYIKQDGLTGPTTKEGKMYGGNKLRKLEFLLGDALAHGAQEVMTFGCVGSNHAVATSVYANKLGLDCICLLKPQANSYKVKHNLLMHQYYDAQLNHYQTNQVRQFGALMTWFDRKQKTGNYPYIIPTGGSNAIGTLGFVNAAFELKEQIDANIIPEPDVIYVACGSRGTVTGLLLGCKAAGIQSTIIAVQVEPGDFYEAIKQLYYQTQKLITAYDPAFPVHHLTKDDFVIRSDFYGEGYAIFTPEGMQAKQLLSECENIELDGTYSAKAFACLVDDAQRGILKDKNVLFWNTYCGFDYSDWFVKKGAKEKPSWFDEYFDKPVQEWDDESE